MDEVSVGYSELAPDLKISPISTGLWQIADMERDGRKLDQQVMSKAIAQYVEAGLTTFDMADHYGSAEIITGQYRREYGQEAHIQLLTKWVPRPGKLSMEDVRGAILRSLDRMQMISLDLLQYHAWNYADPSWLDGLFYLQELKEEGLIRHIGLTNVDAAHLRIAIKSGIDIVSNQVSYSLLDQRASESMTTTCEELGVKILAFGVLGGGFLSDRWLDQPEPKKLSTWSQMKYKRYIDVIGGWAKYQELLRQISVIAQAHEVSIAAIAARFILDRPYVGSIILGARLGQSEHISDTLDILKLNLTDEDEAKLSLTLDSLDPIPGNCGDEYRKPPFLTATGDLSHHLDTMPSPYPVNNISNHRSQVLSGTIWEDIAGFSRAVRIGNRILVSGTTATHGSKLIGGNDPAAQTAFIIDKIEGAIQSLGGHLSDVVRTRIYIDKEEIWEPVALVHGARFEGIQPVNTMVIAGVIGDGYLVEIEVEAIVS